MRILLILLCGFERQPASGQRQVQRDACMDIRGSTVLITAGAKRLGREIALTLARRGANIAISFWNSSVEAAETVRQIEALGVKAVAFRANLSHTEEVTRLFEALILEFSVLDVLVNNAAIFARTPIDQVTDQTWDEFLEVNLKSTFFCSQQATRLMSQRGLGKIINLACTSGERPWPSFVPYSASKAGVISLTRSMALALAPAIQVNAIAPGPVLLPNEYSPSEASKAARSTLAQRIGSARDVTRTVEFLIEGPDYVTGQTIAVDGGRLAR